MNLTIPVQVFQPPRGVETWFLADRVTWIVFPELGESPNPGNIVIVIEVIVLFYFPHFGQQIQVNSPDPTCAFAAKEPQDVVLMIQRRWRGVLTRRRLLGGWACSHVSLGWRHFLAQTNVPAPSIGSPHYYPGPSDRT